MALIFTKISFSPLSQFLNNPFPFPASVGGETETPDSALFQDRVLEPVSLRPTGLLLKDLDDLHAGGLGVSGKVRHLALRALAFPRR